MNTSRLIITLEQVFQKRQTHNMPKNLPPPPSNWEVKFKALGAECGIEMPVEEAFA